MTSEEAFKEKKRQATKAWRQAQLADPEKAAKLKAKEAIRTAKKTEEAHSDPVAAKKRSERVLRWRTKMLSTPEGVQTLREREKAARERAAANPDIAARNREHCRRYKAIAYADPIKHAEALEKQRAYNLRAGHAGVNPEQHRARRAAYVKARRKSDPVFYLASALRIRMRKALLDQRYVKPRAASVTAALGCTYVELRSHIEAKFTEGMTWENAGLWHIDHIRPLASFDLLDPSQFAVAAHYTNLQPLWAADNLRKSDSVA